ncbi:acyl-CoA thioesterase [Salinactinospora qingdaonensis]
MADLDTDSAVSSLGEGRFTAVLSRDWSVWGPNGGYLAAIALRAAGAMARFPRPASLSCNFLGVATFAAVDVEVTALQRSRRAECLRVEMTQRGKPILHATVWTLAETVDGPAAEWTEPPIVPGPERLPALEAQVAAEQHEVLPIWLTCYEIRLAGEHDEGADRPARDPVVRGWMRMREPGPFASDVWLDACRAIVAADLVQFPAVTQGFPARDLTFVAPSLDLYTAFHRPAEGVEWLLVEGQGVAAGGGLIAGRASVWAPDGRPVATGSQQMLVRGGTRPTASSG